jgi:hypothetical protein
MVAPGRIPPKPRTKQSQPTARPSAPALPKDSAPAEEVPLAWSPSQTHGVESRPTTPDRPSRKGQAPPEPKPDFPGWNDR